MSIFTNIELREIILGGQDGLVNVLGLSLGLFAAQASGRVILVAGLAAGFSEAISMGAVAYTSTLADKNRLKSLRRHELLLSSINVGVSALIGAFIPIVPFLFFSNNVSVIVAVILAGIILFSFGIFQARKVGGIWWKSGIEILIIGLVSAFAGFLIGLVLKID